MGKKSKITSRKKRAKNAAKRNDDTEDTNQYQPLEDGRYQPSTDGVAAYLQEKDSSPPSLKMKLQNELNVTAIKDKDTLFHDVRSTFKAPQTSASTKATTPEGYAARPDFGIATCEIHTNHFKIQLKGSTWQFKKDDGQDPMPEDKQDEVEDPAQEKGDDGGKSNSKNEEHHLLYEYRVEEISDSY